MMIATICLHGLPESVSVKFSALYLILKVLVGRYIPTNSTARYPLQLSRL